MKYILGAYSNIPYGAKDEDYEKLLTFQLRPLFTYLYQNPSCCLVLKLGQNFYEWLDSKYPEINMLIFDLCKKDQMELLVSPLYNAILSIIPPTERNDYVEKPILYLKKKFGKRSTGFFFTEQIFHPSIINTLSYSLIDYSIISTYSQFVGKTLIKKPFVMSEFGKMCCFFPSDDNFSKELLDFSCSSDGTDKFLTNIDHLTKQCTGYLHTIMLNLDHLVSKAGTFNVFPLIFGNLGNKCILPSEYIKSKRLFEDFYLPALVYGNDININGHSSINQFLFANKMNLRNVLTLEFLRETVHGLKKNSDLRKRTDSILFKAGYGSGYLPLQYKSEEISSFSNKQICLIEQNLLSEENFQMPIRASISGISSDEQLFYTKNVISYISLKGAVVQRLVNFDFLKDFAFTEGNGIFFDNFKSKVSGQTSSLISKVFEIESIDKKRQDVTFCLPQLEIFRNNISVYKRYRIKPNSFCLDYDLENLKKDKLDNIILEICLNLNLGESAECQDVAISENGVEFSSEKISFVNKKYSFTFSVFLNARANIFVRAVKDNLGFIKYHHIKLSFPLNIDADSLEHLAITIKIDKVKET